MFREENTTLKELSNKLSTVAEKIDKFAPSTAAVY